MAHSSRSTHLRRPRLAAVVLILIAACGRLGFDPLSGADNDGSTADLDAGIGDAGTGGGLDATVIDAGPLVPLPAKPVTSASVQPDCPIMKWTGSSFAVVWAEARDGNNELYLAMLDANGAPLRPEVRLTDDAASSVAPTLVPLGGGQLAVAWADDRSGDQDIYWALFDQNGNPLIPDTRVTDDASASSAPEMVWNGQTYAIVFHDLRDGNHEIYQVRLGATGAKLAPDERFSEGSGFSLNPSIVWTGSQEMSAWMDQRLASFHVFGSRFDGEGSPLATDQQLTVDRLDTIYARTAMVWTGQAALIGWSDERTGVYDVYTMRWHPDGRADPEVRVTDALSSSVEPVLAWAGPDGAVVWRDNRDGNTEIYAARIDGAGRLLGEAHRVTTEGAASECPNIAWSGEAYGVTWRDERDGNRQIYFAPINR